MVVGPSAVVDQSMCWSVEHSEVAATVLLGTTLSLIRGVIKGTETS
jgi:hypothetical protein